MIEKLLTTKIRDRVCGKVADPTKKRFRDLGNALWLPNLHKVVAKESKTNYRNGRVVKRLLGKDSYDRKRGHSSHSRGYKDKSYGHGSKAKMTRIYS